MPKIFENPNFWRGCLATRRAFLDGSLNDYERSAQAAAAQRIEGIIRELGEGRPIADISEYRDWLAYAR